MSLDKELIGKVVAGQMSPEEALEAMRENAREYNGTVDATFVAELMNLGLETPEVVEVVETPSVEEEVVDQAVVEELVAEEEAIDLGGSELGSMPMGEVDEEYVEEVLGSEDSVADEDVDTSVVSDEPVEF